MLHDSFGITLLQGRACPLVPAGARPSQRGLEAGELSPGERERPPSSSTEQLSRSDSGFR